MKKLTYLEEAQRIVNFNISFFYLSSNHWSWTEQANFQILLFKNLQSSSFSFSNISACARQWHYKYNHYHLNVDVQHFCRSSSCRAAFNLLHCHLVFPSTFSNDKNHNWTVDFDALSQQFSNCLQQIVLVCSICFVVLSQHV
jgi:hypothetical protein